MKITNSSYRIASAAAALLAGAAVWTLREIEPPIATSVVPVKTELRPALVEVSARPTPIAVPSPNEESPLFPELFHTGDEAVRTATTQILTSPDVAERAKAADALAAHGTFDSVSNLVNLALIERNAEARATLLESFRNITSLDGLHALASVITATRQKDVIDATIASLSRSGSREVLDSLVGFYRERNDGPFQKNAALRAIRAMQNPEASRGLAKLAVHAPEPALVEAANHALASMGRANIEDER